MKNIRIDINGEELKKKLNIKDGVDGKNGTNGKDGINGKTPIINTSDIALEASTIAQVELEKKIPTIPQIVDKVAEKIPTLNKEIRDGLELFEGAERLKRSAIDGLDDYEEISELARQPRKEIKKFYGGGGITTYEKIAPNVLPALSSGVITGGAITIATNPAQFNISDGSGIIIDCYTNPLIPKVYELHWSGLSNIAVTNIATQTVTYVFLDKDGNVYQKNTEPTDADHRTYCFLGQLGHTNLTSISTVINSPDFMASPISQMRDLEKAIGIINTGNSVVANGANLFLDKTAGTLFMNGINFHTNNLIPSERSYSAGTNISWRYRTVTGAGSIVSSIDPNNYDIAGTITALIGNEATNQRVYLTIGGNVVIQYGQTKYSNLIEAIEGLASETFEVFPNLETASLIGIISIERNTTSLLDDTKCRITKTSKFGEIGSGGGGGSTPDLQAVTDIGATTDNEITIPSATVKQAGTNSVILGDTTGNTRGSYSVDIQSIRSVLTQVASGENSIAMGANNTASGYASSSIGVGNTASGDYSASIGSYNTASGYRSISIGSANTITITGARSTASGVYNTVAGGRSSVSGYNNEITSGGSRSAIVGNSNFVSAEYGFILGGGTSVIGTRSVGAGYQLYVAGTDAFAIGQQTSTFGTTAGAIGYRTQANNTNSIAIGSNLLNPSANTTMFGSSTFYVTATPTGLSVQNHNPLASIHSTGNILSTSIASLGSEKVTNGSFTGNATGWTLGTGWAYSSNKVTKNADGTGTLSQNVSVTAGKYYYLTFDIADFTAGTLDISLGGATVAQLSFGHNDSFQRTYKATFRATTTGNLIFTPSNTARITTIDNVSVKEITGGNIQALGGVQIRTGEAWSTSGRATLVGGTVTVNTTAVTANSNIMLTSQVDGGTVGFLRVSGRTAGTSFTITSSSGTDTSQVGWIIIEPL